MKFLFIVMALLTTNFAQAYSDCEATIEEGQHTATEEQAAINAAWEEAADNCYPGKAERLASSCTAILQNDEVTGHHCTQEVSCTTCGDDLARKYEGLEQ